MTDKLFDEYKLGGIILKNRFVMAPMTRNRSGEGNIPNDINALYYMQRSSAGLIITEGSQVSPQGAGYINTPGIYNEAQIEGWKKVTKAVHENNGKIFLQLWHVGRISHSDFHSGELPVAPSAIKPLGKINTPLGLKDFETPRALEIPEIKAIVEDFKNAAFNANSAEFDGVEIHAANCYLPHQFLWNGSNIRTDEYGGSIENRARFIFEIIEAVSEVWESNKIGIKLSPSNNRFGMDDTNPVKTMDYVVNKLNDYDLAYLHLAEPMGDLSLLPDKFLKNVTSHFRYVYNGTIITNGGHSAEKANEIIANGDADLAAFGKFFISNPDLPERIKAGATLNDADPSTFYGGGVEGYVDYPFMGK